MKVIVVANQKGGVGKSTISCNLAVCAAKDGKRTALVDADPQGSSIQFRALRQTDDILAVAMTKPTILQDIKHLSDFDIVVVDSGGRDNALFRSAVTSAIYGILLIPLLPSALDVWATEDTFKIIGEARSIGAQINACALFNQVKHGTTLVKQAKEALVDLTGDNEVQLLDCTLGDREAFKQAFMGGYGVIEYDPSSKAAEEMNAFYNTLTEILANADGVNG